jgi:molybdopterin-guanine dinucleotide biosynthesis protein MobB
MRIFGVTGWKNAGKTGLMERLVADITARGFSVSTLKHAHHSFDVDQPGKDSHRHRAAGATEVLLVSGHRWALMHELRGRNEPPLEMLLAKLAPVDLVLIEGYKSERHPKIEAWRAAAGHGLIAPDDPTIRAVASDTVLPDLPVPRFDLDDTAAIAQFVLAQVGLAEAGARTAGA